jgi:hypothetical protein
VIVKKVIGAIISTSFNSALDENEEVLNEDDFEEFKKLAKEKKY